MLFQGKQYQGSDIIWGGSNRECDATLSGFFLFQCFHHLLFFILPLCSTQSGKLISVVAYQCSKCLFYLYRISIWRYCGSHIITLWFSHNNKIQYGLGAKVNAGVRAWFTHVWFLS